MSDQRLQAPVEDRAFWRERLSEHSEWPKVPEHTKDAMLEYLAREYPTMPGSWFWSVLTNDLSGAVVKADRRNRASIVPIVAILHDRFPAGAWGTEEKVRAWMGSDEALAGGPR